MKSFMHIFKVGTSEGAERAWESRRSNGRLGEMMGEVHRTARRHGFRDAQAMSRAAPKEFRSVIRAAGRVASASAKVSALQQQLADVRAQRLAGPSAARYATVAAARDRAARRVEPSKRSRLDARVWQDMPGIHGKLK